MAKSLFCLVILLIIINVESKTYTLTGRRSWDNEIKKCWSGGGDNHENTYFLGTLESLGLSYDDINGYTTIVATGIFDGQAKSKSDSTSSLTLSDYLKGNGFKRFKGVWGYDITLGWATQSVWVTLTVKILETGEVDLVNDVYAGSWGSVSCANTKCHVEKIEIRV